jgi:hypothetical protein
MINSDEIKLDHDKLMKADIAMSFMRTATLLLEKVFSEECIELKLQDSPGEAMLIIVELAMILSEHNITELFNSDGTLSVFLEEYFLLKARILLRLSGNMDLYEKEQTNDVNNEESREKWS